MTKKTRKERDTFNEDNPEFRARLSKKKIKDTLLVMAEIGCPSRPVYLEMAISLANKTYGKTE